MGGYPTNKWEKCRESRRNLEPNQTRKKYDLPPSSCPASSTWRVRRVQRFKKKAEKERMTMEKLHPGKLTCPLKRDYFSREYIFQPLIFRGHVSFQGSNHLSRCIFFLNMVIFDVPISQWFTGVLFLQLLQWSLVAHCGRIKPCKSMGD